MSSPCKNNITHTNLPSVYYSECDNFFTKDTFMCFKVKQYGKLSAMNHNFIIALHCIAPVTGSKSGLFQVNIWPNYGHF